MPSEFDPNELDVSGTDSRDQRRDRGQHGENGRNRPFGDAGYLYDIPRPRPEDPPLRDWWIDDNSSDQQDSR